MPRWAVARCAGPPNISAKLKNANIPYQSVWIEGVVSTSLLCARLGYKYQLLPSFVPQIRIRPTQPQAAATLLACFACNYPQLFHLHWPALELWPTTSSPPFPSPPSSWRSPRPHSPATPTCSRTSASPTTSPSTAVSDHFWLATYVVYMYIW